MLKHLHIRNFAILDKIELDLRPGFTTISGETGAGKSIMVDALAFLLGARAERSWVKEGSKGAEIVGDFDLHKNSEARQWLLDNALDEEQQCILRRNLLAAGGSRAWINGRPVALSQLQRLASHLIVIHGQHEHQHLLDAAQQRKLLDQWGQLHKQTSTVARLYDQWKRLDSRLQKLIDTPAADPQYIQLMRYQIDELEREAMSPEQYAQIGEEHKRLAHADELRQGLATALAAVNNEDRGAAGQLQNAINNLQKLVELDTQIKEVHDMLSEAAINLTESEASLHTILQRAEANPEQLARLDQQLSRQHALARKHQVEPEQLQSQLNELTARISELSASDELRTELESQRTVLCKQYRLQAGKLSSQRAATADKISQKATELLNKLGFNGALIKIDVIAEAEAEPRSYGTDKIQILIRTNPGQSPGLLQKIASGGELSRVSLALQLATRNLQNVNAELTGFTQVYDEIDAGIGGDTANRVGSMLAELGSQGQVLCVTHLAQVAARADQQFQVNKRSAEQQTEVSVVELRNSARVEEIARMLSGKLSATSRKHAEELLAG